MSSKKCCRLSVWSGLFGTEFLVHGDSSYMRRPHCVKLWPYLTGLPLILNVATFVLQNFEPRLSNISNSALSQKYHLHVINRKETEFISSVQSLSHSSKGEEGLYQTVMPVLALNNNSLLLWGCISLLMGKPSLTSMRRNRTVLFFTQRTVSKGEREKAGAQQSGLWASMQQRNPRDLSITGRLLLAVVVGSIQAPSIASLLIAMCTDNTAHALYFHVSSWCFSVFSRPWSDCFTVLLSLLC